MIVFAVVIVVLIISACWGKISIDSLNNNPKFNVISSVIYLFLSIIISIVYYKTTTVYTNFNQVKIDRFNGPVDEKGNILDVAQVQINYRMHIDNIVDYVSNDDYTTRGGFNTKVYPYMISDKRKYDSLEVDTIFKILFSLKEWLRVDKRNLKDSNDAAKISLKEREIYYRNGPEYQEILKRVIDKKGERSETDSKILSNALEEILDVNAHLYTIIYGTSKTPNFLPYETYKDSLSEFLNTPNDLLCFHFNEPIKRVLTENWVITEEELIRDMGLWNANQEVFVVFESNNGKFQDFVVSSNDSTYNHIDYFTAADISQQTYKIRVKSDIPLKQLFISFDEPIEISSIYPKPDTISLNSISYDDSLKLVQVLDAGGVQFHAKFPRYENKQLVRSLVLTTILVCVISLFCINAFLIIVTIFNIIKASPIIVKYKRAVKIIAKIFLSLVLMIMLGIVSLYVLCIFGYPISISENEETLLLGYVVKSFALIGIVLLLMILFLFAKYIINRSNTCKLFRFKNKEKSKSSKK